MCNDDDDVGVGVVWITLLCTLAHLMTFGMKLMSVMWVYLWPYHCVLNAWPREPTLLCLSRVGMIYGVNAVGHVGGLEK